MKITSIDLFILINIPLSAWLGFTGRVDWWVIILIWMMTCEMEKKFKN